ncbi:MAG: hypothetical protein DRI40_01950 [Chloroflexi bacterium]|nr:MAG: hypothetical protein DRI40_01950 [Chloroflexota bacterium]
MRATFQQGSIDDLDLDQGVWVKIGRKADRSALEVLASMHGIRSRQSREAKAKWSMFSQGVFHHSTFC